ncbi:MAG TPA: hypothetical protein PK329_04295 [Myxococcota bacterium]|nr:hypothetical protein [Myxococcota bacterium]HOS61077.1 hypothetical protein [Myxococcota bacterium]HPL24626.1 hypothetical protein [Myxococcota bacterium]
MQTLTEKILQADLGKRVIFHNQVARLVTGSDQRRYNLVNRALNSGELVRLRRGLYMLSPKITGFTPHRFVIAQAIVPGSFVSMETALSWHGLIPEQVHSVLSMVPGPRLLEVDHDLVGHFQFLPSALVKGQFLQMVDRHQFGPQFALVASPIRAVTDIIYIKKLQPQDMAHLFDFLRIDRHDFPKISKATWNILANTYQHSRMVKCIRALQLELKAR